MATDHNGIDAQEEIVLEHALKDIELVVKTTVVKLVEDLHPNEGVEDDCVHLTSKKPARVILEIIPKYFGSSKIEYKRHNELVDGLSNYHLPHSSGEKRSGLWRRFAVKNLFRRSIGSTR